MRRGNRVTSYRYDPAGQLVEAAAGKERTSFSYDAAGRRVQEGSTKKKLSTVYDARGLAQRIEATGTGVDLTEVRSYDATGALIKVVNTKQGSPQTTGLVWDASLPVPEVAAAVKDRATTSFVYGVRRGFGAGAGATSVFSYDVHGSALRAGSGGDWAEAGSYDAFGVPADSSPHTAPSFGYRGEVHLLGSIHLRARDYDASTGAFFTPDPLPGRPGHPSYANPYAYGANDPINHIDPLGLSSHRASRGSEGESEI